VRKNIQVAYNGQFNCSTLELCDSICKHALDKIESPQYICCDCYECEEGHLHIKPEKKRPVLSCTMKRYHKENVKKNLELLAQWLLIVAKNENSEYQKNILMLLLSQVVSLLNSGGEDKNSSSVTMALSETPDHSNY